MDTRMNDCQFTAQELVNVFLVRWLQRDMANTFLGYLRPIVLSSTMSETAKLLRSNGPIKFAPRFLKEWK